MRLPRNCSKPFRTLVIHGDMARHGSYPTKNLKIHTPPASKLAQIRLLNIINALHVIIDPNIFCMFRAGNSRFCTTFAENSQNFKARKTLRNAPKLRSLDFLGPDSEAPGHRCPWRPPRRLYSAKAPQPRRGRSAPPSAAASNLRRFLPGSVGRCGRSRGKRRTLWAAELYPFNRQTNDECFGLNIFKTIQNKKCKKHSQTIANTPNKFQYIFPTNYLQ